MIALFRITAFAGAFLYFVVQPMLARRLLPQLGGSPVVWNTALVFFQMLLLAGYAYAHATSRPGLVVRSRGLHLLVAALPLLVLAWSGVAQGSPVVTWSWAERWLDPEAHPVSGLLATAMLAVGLPGFVLAAGSPILQRWFASGQSGRDPYVLFAAANAGSLAALIGYPFFIERRLGLTEQWWMWSGGYAAYVGLLMVCAAKSGRTLDDDRRSVAAAAIDDTSLTVRLTRSRQLRWLGLSAAPAAALPGVTGFLTTDLASVPLL